jgi:hypothetical protein
VTLLDFIPQAGWRTGCRKEGVDWETSRGMDGVARRKMMVVA